MTNCTRHAFTDGRCTSVPGGCERCPEQAELQAAAAIASFDRHVRILRALVAGYILTVLIGGVVALWLIIAGD